MKNRITMIIKKEYTMSCPVCGDYVNLEECEDNIGDNEESLLNYYEEELDGSINKDKDTFKVTCPSCEQKVIIDSIEYN